MKYVTTQLRALIGLFCLSFVLTMPASALDTGVYLDASASEASSIQTLDTSLELKADATTSDEGNKDRASAHTDVRAEDEEGQDSLWSLFGSHSATTTWKSQNGFWANLAAFFRLDNVLGTTTLVSNASEDTLTYTRIENVSATHATVSWSPSEFSSISVYYATSTPVVIASTTLHVSPWKLWKHESVTLKKLVPDTTYFYKVVAHTDSGTTTTAEASFKTLLK